MRELADLAPPLIRAIWRADLGCARDLLESGADPNVAYGGISALCWAVRREREIMRALLAGSNDPNSGGWDASIGGPLQEDVAVVALLLDAGADIHAHDEKGGTALMSAAKRGHLPVVELLLERGATVDASDEGGHTALHWAAIRGDYPEMVRRLIDAGADVSRQSKNGTALTAAAMMGHLATVNVLLAAGADVSTPERILKATALSLASSFGHSAVVRVLIAAGADVDHRDQKGWTALIYASKEGHLKVVQALLDAGANANMVSWDGYTARQLAEENSNPEVVALLKETGAIGLS